MKNIKKASIKNEKIILELESNDENLLDIFDIISQENSNDVEIDIDLLRKHIEKEISLLRFSELYKGLNFYKRYKNELRGLRIDFDRLERTSFSFNYAVLILKFFKEMEILNESEMERVRNIVESNLDYRYNYFTYEAIKDLFEYDRELAKKLIKKLIVKYCNRAFCDEIESTFLNALEFKNEANEFVVLLRIVELVFSNDIESEFKDELQMLREKIRDAIRNFYFSFKSALITMFNSEYYIKLALIMIRILDDDELKKIAIKYACG